MDYGAIRVRYATNLQPEQWLEATLPSQGPQLVGSRQPRSWHCPGTYPVRNRAARVARGRRCRRR